MPRVTTKIAATKIPAVTVNLEKISAETTSNQSWEMANNTHKIVIVRQAIIPISCVFLHNNDKGFALPKE